MVGTCLIASFTARYWLPNNQMQKTGAMRCFYSVIHCPLLIWSVGLPHIVLSP
jgi:hypothetical protein